MIAGDDDFGKGFFTDVLRHIAQTQKPPDNKDEPFVTGRDLFNVSFLLLKESYSSNIDKNEIDSRFQIPFRHISSQH